MNHCPAHHVIGTVPKPDGLPLSQEDWGALPVHVQGVFLVHVAAQDVRIREQEERIREQEERIREQEERIREQEERIHTLEARVRELEARLGQDSSNSSKPPSSDPPWTKRKYPKRERGSGRRRGAQVGHEGARRATIPPEKVTRIEEHRPTHCERCGEAIPSTRMVEGNHRWQVVEIPPIVPEVVEHRVFEGLCACGHTPAGALPAEAKYGTGPRLTAFAAELSGRYRLSREETADLLTEVLGVQICKGTVQACCERVSEALSEPVAEVERSLPEAAVVHVDETGWKVAGKKAWLWVFATVGIALFVVHPRRGRDVLERVFGRRAPGGVVSDRWSAYTFFSALLRQLCWSHLLRDFEGIVDAKGAGSEAAKPMVAAANGMFSAWHAFREGEIPREALAERVAPFRGALRDFAEAGAGQEEDRRWRGLGRDLVRFWPAVFRFVDVEGVEPTNNLAEQDLRAAVLWRRSSQGTRSEAGSLFASRMLTAAATCNRQKRNLLAFLEAAVLARLHGRAPPGLLPSPA